MCVYVFICIYLCTQIHFIHVSCPSLTCKDFDQQTTTDNNKRMQHNEQMIDKQCVQYEKEEQYDKYVNERIPWWKRYLLKQRKYMKALPSERNEQLREKMVQVLRRRELVRISQLNLNNLREKNKESTTDVTLYEGKRKNSPCWRAFKGMISIDNGHLLPLKKNKKKLVDIHPQLLQLTKEEDEMGDSNYNMVIFNSLDDLNCVKSTVIDMSYALVCYGVAAHRLDYYSQLISRNYGLVCDTWCNPTGLFITFHESYIKNIIDHETGLSQTIRIPKTNHFVKVRSSALDLMKLQMLEQLSDKILQGKLTILEARESIKQIINAKPLYGHFMLLILARFFTSIMMSIMFDSNPAEVLAASVAGLFSGLLALVARNYDNYAQVNVICTGFVSGAIAIAFKLMLSKISPVSAFIVSIAGVAPLLPGFGIAVSVLELSAGQVVSGTCRLISALLTALQVAFGVLIPHKFGSLIPLYISLSDQVHYPNPLWIKGLLLPLNIFTLIISMKAPISPISLVFSVVTCYCSFFVTYFLNTYTQSRIASTFISSVMVGLISNIFGWISSKHSAIIICSVGITFLLPGSLSFRSMQTFLMDDTPTAVKFISDVTSVCISLTIGLLVSNILVPLHKKLRW